jgi:hypothetical protein
LIPKGVEECKGEDGELTSPAFTGLEDRKAYSSQNRLLVESLDYIITISGVSRLVSEADSLEAEGTSPADHPILTAFHAFAVIVTDPAVACEAIRAFQQFATCTSNGWFISVEGSHYRLTPTI